MYVCGQCGARDERRGYCTADGQLLAETDDPLLGIEIGRYRLARVIGMGGMGCVYLAVQPAIGSRVAIKVLAEHCARDPALLDRFFAEARAVNLIRHENIAGVLDMAVLENGRPYIVMELVEGTTIGRLCRGGTAPLGGIADVMCEALGALDAAHAIGIVHRDFKSDNVMVTANGHAKVLDFGIAKLSPMLFDTPAHTQTGSLLGTPAYMAPEQIDAAARVDARSDVYAAGVVLYEAATGRTPFVGSTNELIHAHVTELPPPPGTFRPDLPPALGQVILMALEKDPDRRFRSAAAMAQALANATAVLEPSQQGRLAGVEGSSGARRARDRSAGYPPAPGQGAGDGRVTPPAFSVAEPGAAPPRRRRALAIGAAALLAIAASVIVIVATGSDASDAPASTPAPVAAAPHAPDAASHAPDAAPASPLDASPRATPPPPTPVTTPGPPSSGIAVPRPRPAKTGSPPPNPSSTQPRDEPPTQPARPLSTKPTRAELARSFGVSPRSIALPDEVPIQRQPRYARARYNAKNFDVRAFLAQAQALAGKELASPHLVKITIRDIAPDGRVDLTRTYGGVIYSFLSTKRVAQGCRIHVKIDPRLVELYVEDGILDFCTKRAIAPPRCTVADVWRRAQARGATVSDRSTITFDEAGWFVNTAQVRVPIPDC